jgi:hypothetical protein
MSIRYPLGTVVLFFSILASCAKDNPPPGINPTPPSNSDPLLHKWNIVRHIDTTVWFNGPFQYLDYWGTNLDYLNFRTDGKMYQFEDGLSDSATFTVGHDTLFVRRNHVPFLTTFKIELLTEDSLQLNGYYQGNGSHDYGMAHYYLNR